MPSRNMHIDKTKGALSPAEELVNATRKVVFGSPKLYISPAPFWCMSNTEYSAYRSSLLVDVGTRVGDRMGTRHGRAVEIW